MSLIPLFVKAFSCPDQNIQLVLTFMAGFESWDLDNIAPHSFTWRTKVFFVSLSLSLSLSLERTGCAGSMAHVPCSKQFSRDKNGMEGKKGGRCQLSAVLFSLFGLHRFDFCFSDY